MDEDKLLAELVRDEGESLKPYRCPAGKLTIGVGHNLDAKGISPAASRFILREEVEDVKRELDAALPRWRTLTDARQRVLVNMGFNLGVPGLLAFTRTLDRINVGDYLGAAQAMLASKWARQVGPRATRLAVLMRDG